MKKGLLVFVAGMLMVNLCYASNIKVGEPLPPVSVTDKGQMVIEYGIKDNKMVFKEDSDITYRPWETSELTGKIRCIYHLAARTGIDEINKPFIDALIEANLPEFLPDSPYKTTTILNTNDALWGTTALAAMQFRSSQEDVPYAYYVTDAQGLSRKAWGLKEGDSAVAILDKAGNVIYFKEGKMSPEEINSTVALIKSKLGM